MTAAERAYAFMRDQILAGRFPGGMRVTEGAVAEMLGCSRTPVREGMRRLHVEGLLVMARHAGARVATWTRDELAEVSTLRAYVESYAAALAARKAHPAFQDRLEGLCEQMDGAVAARDILANSRLNIEFHRTILEATGNCHLQRSAEALWSLPMIARKYALFDHERLRLSLHHHREIVSAIRARDPDWAEAIMRNHILAARHVDDVLGSESSRSELQSTVTESVE